MREAKCAQGERCVGVMASNLKVSRSCLQGLGSAITVPQTRNFVHFVFFPSLKCINSYWKLITVRNPTMDQHLLQYFYRVARVL